MNNETDTAVVTLTLAELQAIRAALGECYVINGDTAAIAVETAIRDLTRMVEPTYPGAVVMTDAGMAVYADPENPGPWHLVDLALCWRSWADLSNPRPLRPDERAEYGIPTALPDLDDEGLVEKAAQAMAGCDRERWDLVHPPTQEMYRDLTRIALGVVKQWAEG